MFFPTFISLTTWKSKLMLKLVNSGYKRSTWLQTPVLPLIIRGQPTCTGTPPTPPYPLASHHFQWEGKVFHFFFNQMVKWLNPLLSSWICNTAILPVCSLSAFPLLVPCITSLLCMTFKRESFEETYYLCLIWGCPLLMWVPLRHPSPVWSAFWDPRVSFLSSVQLRPLALPL